MAYSSDQHRNSNHPFSLLSLFLFFYSSTAFHHFQNPILFPDHVLLTLSNPHHTLPPPSQLHCLFYNYAPSPSQPLLQFHTQPLLSTDRLDHFRSIARCPLPNSNFSAVELRRHGDLNGRSLGSLAKQRLLNWNNLAYEASLDGDTAVVFVKGLNLRPHVVSDPTRFRCHFGLNRFPQNGAFWLTTKAVTVAQEVVRCSLPQSIKNHPEKARGITVTVSHVTDRVPHPVREFVPSVATIHNNHAPKKNNNNNNDQKKHVLCACTMVWNQARALPEWVTYHAWLGVEQWFVYDNNSDDNTEQVVNDLNGKGYKVNRVTWPWVKTQEAGFSHCALKAKEECEWVGFFDVDEFFYFPKSGKNALKSMVVKYSNSKSVAEIRTSCHSFGPSGLESHPKQGVTVGYTCRVKSPERHKSIVRPELLDLSLLNLVHHFEVKEGYGHRNAEGEGNVVVNHYKYQVWERFKEKFHRRVATYVVDWKEELNRGSKDRAPGLGTEAVEPSDWRWRFCVVWDTGLKDLIVSNFADAHTGLMPWERT